MQQIEQGIYLNSDYIGVTLGGLVFPMGTILIDAPPHPDDGQAWGAVLRNLGGGGSRLLINLDSHLDRTIGARALDCPVMAHQRTSEEIGSRPAVFKGQHAQQGAEWEALDSLTGIRWAKPNLTFTEQTILEWGHQPVVFEHHPGPDPGAIWVILPESHIVFVGDTVLPGQPPFLAKADIPTWVEALSLLLSAQYSRYMIISSRGGLVEKSDLREQRNLLKDILRRLERLHNNDAEPEATEKLVPKLLAKLDYLPNRQFQYEQRLRYGLLQYYINHYHPDPNSAE